MANHLVDLYEHGAREVIGEHFPAIVKNNTVDGRLVAMPWFTDAGLLFYRTDLLEKYGYDGPPETWDELEEMAKTIQDGEILAGRENLWGFVWQGNIYEGLTCNALEWIASHGGGTIVNAEKHVTINNPQAQKALERAARWIGYISPPVITAFEEESARRWWESSNAAFMRNWPYAYASGLNSPVRGRFDVARLPGEKAGQGGLPRSEDGSWQSHSTANIRMLQRISRCS